MESFESLNSVTVVWRGNKYVVEMNPDASLKNLGDQLQKLTNVKADTLRLIVPQVSGKGSKLLSPYSKEHSNLSLQESSIVKGKPIRMMGASEDEVEKVQQDAKDHLRIAGFDEEERRMRLRMSPRFNSLIKLPQGPYTFGGFRTLQLPGIELNPPASEALKRMHMLAADPGIVAIMNKHRWSVGIMTEMAPVGYVGISPKCILGFNKNCGEEISLRLRTDDLKGFRKYESIKKTLLHELAHMVFSEHDANFFALDKQLNQEAAALDWTKSRGHTLAAVRSLDYDEEDYDSLDNNYVSHKLGGDASDQLGSARAISVAAAYRRFKDMSAVKSEVSEVHQEPDPDESCPTLKTRPDEMDHLKEVTVLHESSLENPLKQDYEADLDDSSRDCEPDLDDMNSGAQTIDEPDPDDLEAKQIKSIDRNIHLADHNGLCVTNKEPDPDDLVATAELCGMKIDESMAHEEPDPDDSEAKKNNLGNEYKYRLDWGTKVSETMAEPASSFKANEEPDPDDSHANRVARDEPDHGIGLVGSQVTSNMAIDEPDPDDQELQRIQDPVSVICNRLMKAVEMLRTEANPTEASTALQTLFKIIRNVTEHPNETKFKRLRKANPIIQKNVAKYKVAMEILQMIGFVEEAILDGSGITETYIVLKRNDPGLLWLAKSCLEGSVAC